jgi:ribose transport system substrate-binding protein
MELRSKRLGFLAVVAALMGVAAAVVMSTTGAAVGASGSPVTVTFVGADIADPYFIAGKCGSLAAAGKYNVKFTYSGITGVDYQPELTAFQAVVQKHPDAIIVAPFNATAFATPMNDAAKSGIKVFISDGVVKSPGVLESVGTDEINNGKLAADGLAKAIGGKGEVASVSFDSNNPVPAGIVKGFHQELAAKWPNVKVVATEYAGADAAKAASITQSILQAHPNLAGVYGTDTTDAEGVVSGVAAAGKNGQVKIVAQDAGPQQMAQLKSGVLAGITAQAPYQIHYRLVKDAAAAVRGTRLPASAANGINLPGAFITKANMNTPTIKSFIYPTHC